MNVSTGHVWAKHRPFSLPQRLEIVSEKKQKKKNQKQNTTEMCFENISNVFKNYDEKIVFIL